MSLTELTRNSFQSGITASKVRADDFHTRTSPTDRLDMTPVAWIVQAIHLEESSSYVYSDG